MSGIAVESAPRTAGLELRATYRLRVGREVCQELVKAGTQMRRRSHLDALGLREDLAHLLQVLHEIRELGHYGLQESLVSAAALKATAKLAPLAAGATALRYRMEDDGKGFRWGQMGGLSVRQQKLLEWATEGPYEAYLKDRQRNPTPEEELLACAEEAAWLGEAFAEVGNGRAAEACRRVADDLCMAVQEIPEVVEAAGRFEERRQARRTTNCVPGTIPEYSQRKGGGLTARRRP